MRVTRRAVRALQIASFAAMVAAIDIWSVVTVGVASFLLVSLALHLRFKNGGTEQAVAVDWQPAVPGNEKKSQDSSLSSMLKRRTADSHRSFRRKSILRSPRKSAAALTGMSGFFSGKGKSPKGSSASKRRRSSPALPLPSESSSLELRKDSAISSLPRESRRGLDIFTGVWEMAEVENLEQFMVARGVG